MSTRTGEMLAAYFDLRSDCGPVHARIVGLMGRRLVSGAAVPACQTVTPSGLRYAISLDAPELPLIDAPRALTAARRSPEWAHLCTLVDAWDDLTPADRLRVARVLHKLGFWATLLTLTPPPTDRHAETVDAGVWRALTRLRRMATLKMRGEDDFPIPPDMYEVYAAAAHDPGTPLEERISAAVNLAAHHGRNDRVADDIAPWAELAMRLVQSSALTPLLASAAWRAICFLPYYRSDHRAVATMLDEAERLGRAALEAAQPGPATVEAAQPGPAAVEAAQLGHVAPTSPATTTGRADAEGRDAGADDRLLAVENLRVLSQTRGRAARDPLEAESWYRRAVELDPEDPQTHVTLGDHLVRCGRSEEAYASFATAAELGAPYTGYSRMGMERCRI
ncbi:hypothetical protein JIG36_38485 [Actinoplanes sp. LDG1-06]|uniref:Tetratricopeptide repeat protein n=1 Tax=Paractinoplanes ovalisporus TaxID=2810368 RepID=A0ABS2ANR2_9ACTN|nr:hypothetical protein [Actinoplanes ovalisporus]MBM2621408.1 hypothetical protein [Actinoplanes ovalisporus]